MTDTELHQLEVLQKGNADLLKDAARPFWPIALTCLGVGFVIGALIVGLR